MSTPARSEHHNVPFQAIVPYYSQKIEFTNANSQSLPFAKSGTYNEDGTTLISIFSTEDCWIKIAPEADNPVAAIATAGQRSDSFFLPGGIKEYVGVNPGDVLAVVRDTTSGDLHIVEGV